MRRPFWELTKDVLTYLALTMASLVALFPIVWIVTTSFKRPLDTFALPPVVLFKPTFESYRMLVGGIRSDVANPQFVVNSAFVAVGSMVLSVATGALAAYSLSRFRFRGRETIGFGILLTRMLPPVAAIVPLFLIMTLYGLLDTRIGLILAYAAVDLPFAIWMLRSFMDEIPVELEEAAMIDGCSRVQVLFWVTAPLIAPGVAATCVFAFLFAWNEFPLALVLTLTNAKTLPLAVMGFVGEEGVMWGPMSAMATLALLPPIVFTLAAQRYLARGLMMGAVKG